MFVPDLDHHPCSGFVIQAVVPSPLVIRICPAVPRVGGVVMLLAVPELAVIEEAELNGVLVSSSDCVKVNVEGAFRKEFPNAEKVWSDAENPNGFATLPPPETVTAEIPAGLGLMTTDVVPLIKSVSLVVASEKKVILPSESVSARLYPSVDGRRVDPNSCQ